MKSIKITFLKFRLKYFPRFSGKYDFNRILQAEGISVGDKTIFYNPTSMNIDRQRPWMLKIGDYCKITKGVTILTHDYSRSVLRRVYGEIIGEAGQTVIGDNVFIGMNSIILMGSRIGNNVIIGAGSVVSGVIPDNCVAAGNPCRVLCGLEEHYQKRKEKTLKEAKVYYKTFVEQYNREPTIVEMGPFFPLFLERNEEAIVRHGINVDLSGDEKSGIISDFLKTKSEYNSYEAFLQEMRK